MSTDKFFISGLGDTPNDDLWALYLWMPDRLLLVHHEPQILASVRAILSSKVQTEQVRISQCRNYQHNLIDNSVCLNWTIDKAIHARFKDNFSLDLHRHNLLEKGPIAPIFQELQNWAMTVLRTCMVVERLQDTDLTQSMFYAQINQHSWEVLPWHTDANTRIILDRMGQDREHAIKQVKQKIQEIYSQLYWSTDRDEFDHWCQDQLEPSPDPIMMHLVTSLQAEWLK